VVDELDQLSDHDVHAIAHYIASYSASGTPEKETAPQPVAAEPPPDMHLQQGKTLFEKACAFCHEGSSVPHFNQAGISLALNTNLHADSPTNVLQVIVNGIEAHRSITGMPAFGDNMNNEQITALAHYMRHHFAPDAPQWQNVEKHLDAIRESAGH
jgi:nicotinate dehydrogenase subunit B